ncbi:MAG: hypothetical protein IJA34_00830 [Lachnospiraceae bacterium]|nr:hypothetical protein [Lachnospiraceae bacterium]
MVDKKLTGNEIIKVLECCSKRAIYEDCPVGCPMYQFDGDCFDLIQKDILEFINNLQAENEALIAGQETLQAHISNQNKEISRLTLLAKLGKKRADDYRAMRDRALKAEAELEKLKEASEEAVSCFHRMESLYNIKCMELKVAKAEATKEFAERLNTTLAGYEICFIENQDWSARNTIQQISAEIYNLVKEMTEPSLLDKKFGGDAV